MENELEKKVKEFQGLPAHILGLDGWLLRSLPREVRTSFLKDYEKIITKAYHPDRTTNPKEKEKRENYIQAVTEAITYLTSDELGFEMAVEEVPTKTSPLLRLKEEIARLNEGSRRESQELKQQIQINSGLKEEVKNYQHRIEEKERKIISLQKLETFFRLYNYQRSFLQTNQIVPISSQDNLFIRGRRMSLKRTETDIRTGLTTKYTNLFDLVLDPSLTSFDGETPEFFEKIEKGLLSPEDKFFLFSGNKAIYQKINIELVGSLHYAAIREYLDFNDIKDKLENELEIDAGLFNINHRKILFSGKMHEEGHSIYQKRIMPFVMPLVSQRMPALIRYYNDERVRYELFYIKEAKTIPPGTELDLWFSRK